MGESGFMIPSQYVSSPNQDDAQLVHLANAASDDIREIGLSGAVRSASIALNGSGEYALPADFYAYVSDTAWVGTRKVDLPMAPQDWAALNATGVGLYEHRARLLDKIRMLGDVNGETLKFEYISAFPWQSDAQVAKEIATADNDVWLLDRRLLVAGVKWRWKKEKGIEDWQADQQLYQRQVSQVRARDGGSKSLRFGDPAYCPPAPYTPLWIQ